MLFFYFPVFFGFRIKKDYTNNCFFPFAFCSTVFLYLFQILLRERILPDAKTDFWKSHFFLFKSVILFFTFVFYFRFLLSFPSFTKQSLPWRPLTPKSLSYFLSSTVSGLLTSKKNPANINFNKEPVQYTENRHRTRRLWYPCRIQQTLFCFLVYHHFCIRIRTKRKKETSFMYLYNSATHKKAEFLTHTPGRVEMYTCGPTV